MKQKVAQKRRAGLRRKETNAQRKVRRRKIEAERNRLVNEARAALAKSAGAEVQTGE